MGQKEIKDKSLELDYKRSLSSIITKIETSKQQAITTVNKLLVELYWFIGETIFRLQEKSKWGDGVVDKLSSDLRMQYPDMKGLSSRNLWDCKRMYLAYKDYPKLRPLLAEVGWTNHLIILNYTETMEQDEKIKLAHENPSVGLILCRSKRDSVVRFDTKMIVVSAILSCFAPQKKVFLYSRGWNFHDNRGSSTQRANYFSCPDGSSRP